MAANIEKQIEIAERLQLKALEYLEKQLDEGTISSTDMASLLRLLSQNGWRLDPHALPKGLADKIDLSKIDPRDFGDEAEYN